MAYTPGPISRLEDLPGYIFQELLQISAELGRIEEGRFLPILHSAPGRPREGMLVIADGTDWNPRGGKGLYEYRDGNWEKL